MVEKIVNDQIHLKHRTKKKTEYKENQKTTCLSTGLQKHVKYHLKEANS